MAIGFSRMDIIERLRKHFPKYLEKFSDLHCSWESVDRYRIGFIKEKNEKLVQKAILEVGDRIILLKFIEDEAGAITIKVNEEAACTVEPGGRLNESLLEAFTNAIIEGTR